MTTSEIKTAVAYHKKALYHGSEYTIIGFRGFKSQNRIDVEYAIELLDKNNSVLYADLKDVEIMR